MIGRVKLNISIVFIIVAIVFAAGFLLITHMNSPKSFDNFSMAQKSCGHAPVIASIEDGKKNYYEPSDSDNKILSTYNPESFNLSDYPEVRFYCNVHDAAEDGYTKHECCGLASPRERNTSH